MIKHRIKKHYPIRATKFEVLHFIKKREIVCKNDLVDHFGYTRRSAEQRLYTLAREHLITQIPTIGQWRLSKLGEKRYNYFVDKAHPESPG